MSEAPEMDREERLDLAAWMLGRMAGGKEETDRLLAPAFKYSAEKTGLLPARVELDTTLFEDKPNRATRWVEYYLNECRTTGQPPT